MQNSEKKTENIDEFIDQFPPEIREKLANLRRIIQESAPDAEERIAYGMPAFYLNGPLVYFAAFKDHISFFPTGRGRDQFKEELAKYPGGKGTVQFSLNEPLPLELVARITKARAEENRAKASSIKQKR
jgi:uncharacterized protein YdhG (YjbR/CyaY superfamily)